METQWTEYVCMSHIYLFIHHLTYYVVSIIACQVFHEWEFVNLSDSVNCCQSVVSVILVKVFVSGMSYFCM